MTREEVIEALENCSDGLTPCNNCSYQEQGCYTQLKRDAAKLLEFDREKEMASTPPKVVEYKILNREDLLTAFHEYVYAQADFFMNYTGRAETAQNCMNEICGAAVLLNNILNPKFEISDPINTLGKEAEGPNAD